MYTKYFIRSSCIFTPLLFLLISSNNSNKFTNSIFSHVKKIESINSVSSDMDLRFIATNNRIIFLGELDHGDSVSDALSLEIIKTLHEKHGFNILIEEIDLHVANKVYADTLENDIFKSLYKNSINILSIGEYDILNYVQNERRGYNPLEFRGIDLMDDSLVIKDLRQFISSNIVEGQLITNSKEFMYIDSFYRETIFSKLAHVKKSKKVEQFSVACKHVIEKIRASKALSETKKEYWLQEIDNINGYVKWHWYCKKMSLKKFKDYDLRDEQMARNIIWYLNKIYPTEKIIVRVSNFHLTRHLNKIKNNPRSHENIKSCLNIIKDSIKGSYYTIAFTHYFNHVIANRYEPIADTNSVEALLHKHEFKFAFVDLKKAKEAGSNTIFNSYMFLHNSSRVDWADVYDGFIYIDKEKTNPHFNMDKTPYCR